MPLGNSNHGSRYEQKMPARHQTTLRGRLVLRGCVVVRGHVGSYDPRAMRWRAGA